MIQGTYPLFSLKQNSTLTTLSIRIVHILLIQFGDFLLFIFFQLFHVSIDAFDQRIEIGIWPVYDIDMKEWDVLRGIESDQHKYHL